MSFEGGNWTSFAPRFTNVNDDRVPVEYMGYGLREPPHTHMVPTEQFHPSWAPQYAYRILLHCLLCCSLTFTFCFLHYS